MKTLVTVSKNSNLEFAMGDKITFAKDPQSPISKYFISAFLGNKKIGCIPVGKMDFGKDCIMAEEIYTKVPFNFSGTITNFKVVESKNKIKTLFIEVEIDEKLKSKSKVKEEPKKENPSFADDIYEDFFKGSCRILTVDKSTGRLVDMKGKDIDEIINEKLQEVNCGTTSQEKSLYEKLLDKKKRKKLSIKVDFVQNVEKLINEDKVDTIDICDLFEITENTYDLLVEMLGLNIKKNIQSNILAVLPTEFSYKNLFQHLYEATNSENIILNAKKEVEKATSTIGKQYCIDFNILKSPFMKKDIFDKLNKNLFRVIKFEGLYFIAIFDILEEDYFEKEEIVFEEIDNITPLMVGKLIINQNYENLFLDLK